MFVVASHLVPPLSNAVLLQRPGVMESLQEYFSDTGRTIAVFALVVVIMPAVLLFSVRSCMTAHYACYS